MTDAGPLERLVACLSRLPGVGRRSAERMAFRLAADEGALARELHAVLGEVSANTRFCTRCGGLTTVAAPECRICTDPARERALLCVVEAPSDIQSLERAGGFNGRYHVLMGKISPMHGEGPDDIRLVSLLKRVEEEGVREVILALNTDVESDATASYIAGLLGRRKVAVSRLAFGLPAGSGVAYSDPVTLARALRGRQTL